MKKSLFYASGSCRCGTFVANAPKGTASAPPLDSIILTVGFILSLFFTSFVYASTNGAYGELLLGHGYNHLGEQIDGENSTDWVLSGKLGVGYNIDKNIGVEIGYQQFGQRRVNNIGGTSASALINQYAAEIQIVVRLPLSDSLTLLGKIGSAFVQVSQSVKNADAQTANKYQSSYSAWRPDYALGASYALDDFPSLELIAMYSHIVKDNNIPDADLYAAGLIINF